MLVFPAGTEIGLEILAALGHCRNITLFGAGEDVSNHARLAYPEYHIVPSVHHDGWLKRLAVLCAELGIDYVFPAHDDVVLALSQVREQLPAAVISSPADACSTTRSKTATYRRLAGIVPVSRLYSTAAEVDAFPVLVKPDRSQGSQGVSIIDDVQQLAHALRNTPDPLICEYLPGDEYTVDCFTSQRRGLLFAGARRRRRTRNGISVNTITEDLPEVRAMAEAISNELDLRGGWFFQLKRDATGTLTLLEVAPRIAGSMAAHRVSGVNFPLLSILEHEGIDVQIATNTGRVEMDRALRNRYFHEVRFASLYLDLDDTLICNGAINLDIVKLIFACINQGKRVTLITRHRGDLNRTLNKYKLSGLFDEIIHVQDDAPKSRYIDDPLAIFIDDSFSERMTVVAECGIPTFDASMIELLNDQAEPLDRPLP
ncbi:MAG: ATP-grasp domain-containing protein [Gammaproteobacteria bacterium]